MIISNNKSLPCILQLKLDRELNLNFKYNSNATNRNEIIPII